MPARGLRHHDLQLVDVRDTDEFRFCDRMDVIRDDTERLAPSFVECCECER